MKLKKLSEYRRGELARTILLGFLIGGAIVAVLALPGLGAVLALFKPRNKKEEYRFRRTIRSLQRNKLIRFEQRGGVDTITLTEKGSARAVKYSFEDFTMPPPRRWDGLWRLISFDIPERKGKARRAFSSKLRELDFYPLQESLFVYPYECGKEINFMRSHLFIEPHVRYLTVKEIEHDAPIRKHFHLA